MNTKYYFTFDKSNEDIPVLVVFEDNGWALMGPSSKVVNIFTGDEAERIWKTLTTKAIVEYKEK